MGNQLTIVTTTYNRPEKLTKLFKSLAKQTDKNFCWWIVNDGSTISYSAIEKEIVENKDGFDVAFFEKKNGGKHRALNYIIPKIQSKYMMIIDDDDYLVENAVERVLLYSKKYLDQNKKVKSIVFERAKNDQITPMSPLPKKIDFGKRFQYVIKNKINGDFTDVFDTKSLKEFKLPEFYGENFISEGPLYFEFSQKYESVFIKEKISVGDYNVGGLSSNVHQLMAKNINGALFEIHLFLSVPNPMYYKIKKGLLYGYLMKKNKKKLVYAISSAPTKLASFLTLPGYIIGIIKK